MLDKLIEFMLSVIEDVLPFKVIDYYEMGVRLRFGHKASDIRGLFKAKTVLNHGFHFKLPFVDNILTHMVKTTTMNISEQSVTTLDGMSVVVAAVVKYSVNDVEKLLLEVNTPVDALNDMVKGIIRDKIIKEKWMDCNTEAFSSKISKAVKHEATKWGVKVEETTLTDLGLIKSIRLLTESKELKA